MSVLLSQCAHPPLPLLQPHVQEQVWGKGTINQRKYYVEARIPFEVEGICMGFTIVDHLFFWRMKRAPVTNYLRGADQKFPDW